MWKTALSEKRPRWSQPFERSPSDSIPKVVNTIYQIIHVPDNTLLSNEIIPAAEAAEQGASVQEISDMAADGLFGGGPMPTLKM